MVMIKQKKIIRLKKLLIYSFIIIKLIPALGLF